MPVERESTSNLPSGKTPSRVALMARALRHRNFQLFFGGQLISLIGTWMDNIAEAWLVYRLTGSSLHLGALGFCSQIPVFLLAPLGGHVADKYNRHRIVIATQTASMLLAGTLAGLTLSGVMQAQRIYLLYLLAVSLGIVNAFDIPARQAFIVEMVTREDLMNAIALNSSMFNGARIVGPAIAGVLVASIGEGWCFFANAVSYIAVITGLLLMHVRPRVVEPSGTAVENVLEGFRFVRQTPPIRALLLLIGLVSLVAMPYSVLMPIFADRILHGGAQGLGLLMGASGVGALCGALTLAARSGVFGLGRWVMFAAAGLGGSLIAFGFSHSFWFSEVLLLPVGFSMMVQMASTNTLIQSMVPDRLRGRVMSVYSMMFMGMAPIGSLLAGWIADRTSAPTAVILGGIVAVFGAVAFGVKLPELRVAGRQLIIAQGLAGGNPPQQISSRVVSQEEEEA
ncbi:MAG TPA: MFS transporter [Terriglobales bacterium]|nr:MFS transporter [Terriglobales bacterium]